MNSALDYASLSLEDVRRLYDMKEKEILLSNYNLPEKPSTDGYFHIFVKDAVVRQIKRCFVRQIISCCFQFVDEISVTL